MADQPNPDVKPASEAPSTVDGLSVAAMVLGIAALVLFWLPIVNFVVAILAIIFGIIGITRKQSVGMAVAGLATGAIALTIIVVFIIAAIVQNSA